MLKECDRQDSATNENSYNKLKTAVLNLRIKINLHPKVNNNFAFHAYHIYDYWQRRFYEVLKEWFTLDAQVFVSL